MPTVDGREENRAQLPKPFLVLPSVGFPEPVAPPAVPAALLLGSADEPSRPTALLAVPLLLTAALLVSLCLPATGGQKAGSLITKWMVASSFSAASTNSTICKRQGGSNE